MPKGGRQCVETLRAIGYPRQAGQVGVADAVVAVVQGLDALVDSLQHQAHVNEANIGRHHQPRQRRAVLLTRHFLGAGVGQQRLEVETAAQRRVQQGQRTIRCVHRADDVDVGGHRELLAGVRQDHLHRRRAAVQRVTLVGFDQGDQLTEDLADVAPVDFIDHHCKALVGGLPRLAAQLLERAGADFIGHFARFRIARQHRAQPFDELLVAVGLVEGNKAVALHGTGVLLAALELIDQRNQIGAVVAPVSGELPHRIGRLVEHRGAQALFHLHGGGFVDGVVLQGAPQGLTHIAVRAIGRRDGLDETVLGDVRHGRAHPRQDCGQQA